MNQLYDGQLCELYHNWINNPKSYDKDLFDTINKIIYKSIKKHPIHNIKAFENREDVIQDLRLLCINALKRVEPPVTNKRLYNYLKTSIEWHLKTQDRRLGKFIERMPIEREILGTRSTDMSVFNFGEKILNDIAFMLSEGYNKQTICNTLNISRDKLARHIKKLKEHYTL